MQKEDAHKQSREVLHERCKKVVRMYRKGVGAMRIVEQTGLSWTAVNTALRLDGEGSAATLKPGLRGKKPGSGRSLTPAQEQTIGQTICDKRPPPLRPRLRVLRFTGAMRPHWSTQSFGAGASHQQAKHL